MSPKLTFLFIPIDAVGHVNPLLGIAEQLRDRGHTVVFATPNGWKGKFEAQRFVEECYSTTEHESVEGQVQVVSDLFEEIVTKIAPTFVLSSEDKLKAFVEPLYRQGIKQFENFEPKLKEILVKVKPDLIIYDMNPYWPSLDNAGVPWILHIPITPVGISSKNVPPLYSGYPTNGDRSTWQNFKDLFREAIHGVHDDLNKWIIANGGQELKLGDSHLFHLKESPYANIYMYPMELDYTMYRPNPPNWHGFDTFVRSSDETFQIPKKLNNLPGKLIYFSMGTFACFELGVMRRLIGIFAKSPNRFIVSKGPLADQISLADNMWGAVTVPQTKVIPMVDLVINHGGNNTITECFYFGKRILVLPLFCDQLDNGQRIHETGHGLQFHPYKVTEDELLSGIETLLNDDLLERRMISISKRIQSSNSQSRAADLVENIAMEYKNKK